MNFTKINKLNLKSTIDREDIIRANKSILNNRNEKYNSTCNPPSHNTKYKECYDHDDYILNHSSHNTRDEVFLIEEYEATLHGYNIQRKDIKNAFRNASLEFETTVKKFR